MGLPGMRLNRGAILLLLVLIGVPLCGPLPARAQADADASKTYAASFGKDPQFYDFYRAMQSYQTTFVGDGQDKPAPTNIILSPQNDYLKEFTGRTK